MSILSKIEIDISGGPLKDFDYVSINENIYGIDNFSVSCRYEAIEKLDAFLIENAKGFLGLPIKIQTKIKIGNEEKDGLLFKGYVTEIQGTRSGLSDNDRVILSGGSMEILLSGKPNSRAFVDKTLDEIVKEVLKQYEFSKKISPRDKFRYPYIVQFGESDMEFLKRLSVRYGEWFYFNGKEMVFGDLPTSEQELTIGYDLKDFSYSLRLSPVNFSIKSVDPLKPDVYSFKSGSGKADPNLNSYGKHALGASKKLFKVEGSDYYEHLNVNETEYRKAIEKAGERDEISDALNLSDLTGNSVNPFLSAGMYVKVSLPTQKGSASISYLRYLLTSVRHNFDNLFAYSNSFTAVPAEITLPENTDPHFIRTTSHQMGKIADNKDPKNLGRVRINFWWMENDKIMTPWVKVVTPYTQANSGFYFVPAVDSRVLVGFEDGDVEKPYCLGALFDETMSPDPAWAGDYNDKDAKVHAIRTASGQTIELYDDSGNEKIKIYDTEGKNEITLDSANGEISIKATEKLTIEAKEIEIKAENGMKIEAGQDLEQKGTNIKVEAQSGLKEKGMTVEIKADTSLTAEGSASAELKASGNMTIKGAMVMIN